MMIIYVLALIFVARVIVSWIYIAFRAKDMPEGDEDT